MEGGEQRAVRLERGVHQLAPEDDQLGTALCCLAREVRREHRDRSRVQVRRIHARREIQVQVVPERRAQDVPVSRGQRQPVEQRLFEGDDARVDARRAEPGCGGGVGGDDQRGLGQVEPAQEAVPRCPHGRIGRVEALRVAHRCCGPAHEAAQPGAQAGEARGRRWGEGRGVAA